MRARRWLLLVALLVGVGSVVAAPVPPAHACTCVGLTDEQAFARSDVVFAGDILERPAMGPGEVIWTFAVDEVFKGQVAPEQAIVTSGSGGSCGLELPARGLVLVFATRNQAAIEGAADPGTLYASLCGGTRMWDDRVRNQRPGVPAGTLPPGSAPHGAEPPSSTRGGGDGADAAAGAATIGSPSSDDGSASRVAIGAAAVVAVGSIAVVLVRRRRPPPTNDPPRGFGDPSTPR